MSLHDDLTHVQRTLDELVRSVNRISGEIGDSIDMRRVSINTEHLRESLTLLLDAAGHELAPAGQQARAPMVTIPDAPYDPSLWRDAEDEGLGSPHGHAP
jgi:hypothetical protein